MPERVPAEFEGFLAEPRNAILCIARGEGRAPHATPVWFDYVDGEFRVSITRSRVKYRLLLDAPEVTLVVDDAATYRTVIVSGQASIIEDDASLVALRRALHQKYSYEQGITEQTDAEVAHALRQEGRVVVVIAPDHVLSWAGG